MQRVLAIPTRAWWSVVIKLERIELIIECRIDFHPVLYDCGTLLWLVQNHIQKQSLMLIILPWR